MSALPPPAGITDPYEALAALAERERVLVADGLFDELRELMEARDRIVASLPAMPPPAARPMLERAATLQAETTSALGAARDAVAAELRRLSHGRTAVRGYTPAGVTAPVLDHAA